VTGEAELNDAVWGYRDPFAECLPLKDHVAFYTDRVTLEIDDTAQPAPAGLASSAHLPT
jgi:uncharacterized protein (DUF427 family)